MNAHTPPTSHRFSVAQAASLVAMALLLAGCSTQGNATSGTTRTPTAAIKNIDTWALPLDQYTLTTIEFGESNYAENLLMKPCMQNAGYSWDLPGFDYSATDGASFNEFGRRVFTQQLVSTWGYHLAPQQTIGGQAMAEFNASQQNYDSQENKRFDSCLSDARKKLPAQIDTAGSYSIMAYKQAMTDKVVVAAAARWKSCMLPLGIADLPDSPTDFPSPSLFKKFGLDGADGAPATQPGQNEITIATKDFNCQQSSGYRQASYDAEWRYQEDTISKNADALARAQATNAKNMAAVHAVIAQYASKN